MKWLSRFSWVPVLASLEARKSIAYRADFWLNVGCLLFAKVGLAYYVWSEIFKIKGATEIAGYTFGRMMIYYILVSLVYHIVSIDLGTLASDIYDGTLTRFLIYPVSFFPFKYISSFSKSTIYLLQLVIALLICAYIFQHQQVSLQPTFILLGFTAVFLSSYLYFIIAACLEMVAFWVDKVWSLGVMLQLLTMFLGGATVPISIFPKWAGDVLQILPFYYLLSFPVRTFLGELSTPSILTGLSVSLSWSVVFSLLAQFIWRRGIRSYTGVGI